MFERSLSSDVQFLKGVGPRFAKSMVKAGLLTVADVLYHMPRRYEDRRHIPAIRDARPGVFTTVRGRLVGVDSRPTSRGMVIVKAVIRDETGSIALTWFNQPWIVRQLQDYDGEVVAYGQIKEGSRSLEISAPEWEMVEDDDDPDDFARIVPIYPLREGLQQRVIRRAARSAVQFYLDLVEEPLSERILRDQSLKGIRWALRQLHEPDSEPNRLEARKRMVFDEFFFLQVALAMRRAETQQELGIAFPLDDLLAGRDVNIGSVDASTPSSGRSVGSALESLAETRSSLFEEELHVNRNSVPLWDQIHAMLPFELTGAQRRVIEEIWDDMKLPHPMNRLVQGDVGSGKTAVAACCMVAAVRSGYQTALMAPTEILAEQHFANLRKLLEPLAIDVELLLGKLSARDKKRAQSRVENGDAHVVIGTHALIQEGVKFARLGFAVIDEQHRFGVLQRAALRDKGLGNPDILVMTATPIPRTMTMTLYGDLELSVIDELPPGRKPIKTHWKRPFERAGVFSAVRKLIEEGRQAYFVCPMVGESEKLNARAAEELHETLSTEIYPDFRVGLLHGQMKPLEKETAMDQFRRNELDILVATTVIEVGVDVPNSSVMVIEDANRFGLSQLHQLRGRVGRGQYQSFCILIADAKSDEARTRMEVMVETNDGFRIAEEDLKLRGPGELAGTKQSGNIDFRMADLVMDGRLLEVARQAAMSLIERDPSLTSPEHSVLLARVRERRSTMATITVS